MPPISKDLTEAVSKYIQPWRRMSRAYASISILLRGTLIVASAIVAARLGLKSVFCDVTFSVLSVVVAAGTALEAWLKPREKWKGFMTDCENAEDLLIRLKNTDGTDSKRLEELHQAFQVILASHREKNVF
jgi:hypothetical protein